MVRQRSSRVCRSAQAYKKTWIKKKKTLCVVFRIIFNYDKDNPSNTNEKTLMKNKGSHRGIIKYHLSSLYSKRL